MLAMNDIFICYSQEDENIASDVCNLLEGNNYKCWFKKRDFADDDSVVKITEAVRDSRGLLLIYSKDAKNSIFVTTEVDIAFSSDVPILVFSIDDSSIEGKLQFYLKDKPTINAYPDTKGHYDELLKDIAGYLGDGDGVNLDSGQNEAYICYTDEDVLTAEAAAHVLEENGIKCWFKKRDLKAGESVQKISDKIKDSKCFVLIYSDSASKSYYVKTDTELAISSSIPILSFKIDDVEKLDELSDAHWLDAYPNPEDNFRDLVIDTGNLVGKSIDNPKITKKYKNLKKVESKDKSSPKIDEPSKEFTKNYGFGKHFKLIIAAVVIIAIVGVAAFVMSTQTTNVESELNIPEGYILNPDQSSSDSSGGGRTEYKLYENNETGDFIAVNVFYSDSGPMPKNQKIDGYTQKTINGVEGNYKEDQYGCMFDYVNSKGNSVSVQTTTYDLLEKVIK